MPSIEGGRPFRVPFTSHGSGNVPSTSAKINGDALPRTGRLVRTGNGANADFRVSAV